MGLSMRLVVPALLFLGAMGASASPRLRLTNAAVGPISVTAGNDGGVQTLEAFNIGDGALNLSLTSSAPWISASLGEPGNCALRAGICQPILIGLQTASLAKGTFTGLVTVSDPNAVDAPQNITVTVKIGGTVPDSINFTLMPGARDEYVIKSANPLGIIPSTESGGAWLSAPLEGGGSFRFSYNYHIIANAAGVAEGSYNGSLYVFNSPVAAENKSVPVTLTVTAGPILSAPELVWARLAEGSAGYGKAVSFTNRGGGQLAVSEATFVSDSGGEWLTSEIILDGQALRLKFDPTGLAQGSYTGTLQLVSNAVNSPYSLPVTLDVLPAGPPAVDYSSVVNIATQQADGVLAPGMLARLRGDQLTLQEAAQSDVPWPDNLAGTQVYVNGVVAALQYVGVDEIVFQFPYAIDPGDALIQLIRDGVVGNVVGVPLAARSPIIEPAGLANYAKAVLDDGTLAVPIELGGRPAQTGETVSIYAIGLGRTDPAVDPGVAPPGDPLAAVNAPVKVTFGGSLFIEGFTVDAVSATLVPGQPGRYVVKAVIPPEAQRGDAVNLVVTVDGYPSSKVQIAIQ